MPSGSPSACTFTLSVFLLRRIQFINVFSSKVVEEEKGQYLVCVSNSGFPFFVFSKHFPSALVSVCCIALNSEEASFSHSRKEITVVDMTKVDVASHAANTNY